MDAIIEQVPFLVGGLWTTLSITALAWLVMIAFAVVGSLARLYAPRPIRWLSVAVIEVLRGSSTLVLLFWAYYVLPLLGVSLPQFWVGVVVIGVIEGAYASEAVRGAILAVPRGQLDAARVLGFGWSLRMRRVVLPQALPLAIAPIGNLTIALLKFTSLLSFIGIHDLVSRAQQVRYNVGDSIVIFGLLLLVYFLMASVIGWGARRLERHFRIRGQGESAAVAPKLEESTA